jgi:RNA polymerase sigma factor (sigma-70 family)
MATGDLAQALHHLRQSLGDGGETDTQLLARFVAGHDEAAFAALVRRHGALVLGVCQRALGRVHDVEDAFQATFLVLARRAGSVVRGESLGCWLHRVAFRVAMEARAANARRRAREKSMTAAPHPEVAPVEPQDWRPILDEELDRLPEKYRTVVVLCELEGRPRKEAAQQLGVPEGTVSSRLAAARKMLAERLARRGVTLSGAMWAATAAVPPGLVDSTVQAALLVAAGLEVAAAAPAVALMKGAFRAMFMAKLKLVAAAVIVTAALGAGGLAYQAGWSPQARAEATAARTPTEVDVLRKEVELLNLKMQVVEGKLRAHEAELAGLRKQVNSTTWLQSTTWPEPHASRIKVWTPDSLPGKQLPLVPRDRRRAIEQAALEKQVEEALGALKKAGDREAKSRAAQALEAASRKLREHLKEDGSTPPRRK